MSCHDCDCVEGAIHTFGCDMERCPFCGGQLITCGCQEKTVGRNITKVDSMFILARLTANAKKESEWLNALTVKGRIPYIDYPVLCSKCGTLNPELFDVSDKEWAKYIQPDMRETVICKTCYEDIKEKINRAERR